VHRNFLTDPSIATFEQDPWATRCQLQQHITDLHNNFAKEALRREKAEMRVADLVGDEGDGDLDYETDATANDGKSDDAKTDGARTDDDKADAKGDGAKKSSRAKDSTKKKQSSGSTARMIERLQSELSDEAQKRQDLEVRVAEFQQLQRHRAEEVFKRQLSEAQMEATRREWGRKQKAKLEKAQSDLSKETLRKTEAEEHAAKLQAIIQEQTAQAAAEAQQQADGQSKMMRLMQGRLDEEKRQREVAEKRAQELEAKVAILEEENLARSNLEAGGCCALSSVWSAVSAASGAEGPLEAKLRQTAADSISAAGVAARLLAALQGTEGQAGTPPDLAKHLESLEISKDMLLDANIKLDHF